MVQTGTVTRGWGTAALAVAVLALPATPALAQGRWTPPQKLTDESAVLPSVVLGPSGEGIAAWMSREATPGAGAAVSVAVRPPGGRFGQVRQLSPGPAHLGGLLANAAGDTAVLYQQDSTLHGVFRSALGEFAEPVAVGAPGAAAIDAQGNVTFLLAIEEKEPPEHLKHVADRLAAVTRFVDGTLGPVRAITRAERIHGASIGVEPDGDTTVAWRTAVPGDDPTSQPYVAAAAGGGEFSEPQALGPPTEDNQGAGGSQVVTSPAGTLVAWPAQPRNPYPDVDYKVVNHRLFSSFRPQGGAFGPVEEVPLADPRGDSVYGWSIAMSPTGDVAATWAMNGVAVAFRPVGGRWRSSIVATPIYGTSSEGHGSPGVGFDGQGTATVAYVSRTFWTDAKGRGRSGPARLMAARRPRGADRFGPAQEIARAKNIFTPAIAGDPLGNTIVVWAHQEIRGWSPGQTEKGVGAAIWDAREPAVTGFDVDPEVQLPGGEGPAFEFRLSEAASVALTVEQAGRSPKRLARTSFRARRGVGVRAIGTKLAKQLRRSGSYRATIVARDSAGRRSKPRRLAFGSLARR